MEFDFDNRFVALLPQDRRVGPERREVVGALWSSVLPSPVAAPQLLAVSEAMRTTLGLGEADVASPSFVQVFAGNALLPGMQPFASNYGGHQFGSWAGQLGDGRAITLGEVRAGQTRWELQLKGAGETPYSRHADGRAVLRSSIREFLCSEAMHHLGIPGTRALSLIATGEAVVRDIFYDGRPRPEPGAVVCRAAPSFLRFGHFELPSARGDIALLRQLADFCIERDFPELHASPAPYADWFREIARRTAHLVAEWMRVGFVHGVMNTDNMSILGLTLDYGPYGWLDVPEPDFTANSSDVQRRYRFGYQPRIALWNLQQLAAALSPLFADAAPLQAGLALYAQTYAEAERHNAARKLGFEKATDAALPLLRQLQPLLRLAALDMTVFFRTLARHRLAELAPACFAAASYDAQKLADAAPALSDWLERYHEAQRSAGQQEARRQSLMQAANPCFIARNYLVEEAIRAAEAGDLAPLHTLMQVLRQPYAEQAQFEHLAAKTPEWARQAPGCTRLSCSS